MSLFAVEYRYTDDAPALDRVRPEHRAYLAGVAGDGELLGSGPFVGGPGGALLIFSVDDRARLDTALAADPFAVAGLIVQTVVREWSIVIGPWAERV